MTSKQAARLKVGDRVYWDSDQNDRGEVTAVFIHGLTITWTPTGAVGSLYVGDCELLEKLPQ